MNPEVRKSTNTVDIPGQPSGEHDALEQSRKESLAEAEVQLGEDFESPFAEALTNRDEAARFAEELGPTGVVQEVPLEEPIRHPTYGNTARPPIPRSPRELPPYTRYEYVPIPSVVDQQPPQDAKSAFGRVYDYIRQRYEKRQLRKQEVRREQAGAFFTELTPDQRLDMQMTLGFSAAAFAVADRREPYWVK